MKYMGSKRAMLRNGLGAMLEVEAKSKKRIVDLFCGSSSVTWFAAAKCCLPVLSIDLQKYSIILAKAVVTRTTPFDFRVSVQRWGGRASAWRSRKSVWTEAVRLDAGSQRIKSWAEKARSLCGTRRPHDAPIWSSYGGYYFSPTQALLFDSLLATLPSREPQRTLFHAALIVAASKCAASPGHTAQPFKPNNSAGPFLREAWMRNPMEYLLEAVTSLSTMHAKAKGTAQVRDANRVAMELGRDDLVFVDPPYSGVHYSRFYQVLETVASHGCSRVTGEGRYPPAHERPVSEYSKQTTSKSAFEALINSLAEARSTVIVTFPAGKCSNGISGTIVEEICNSAFRVKKKVVKTRFSTLGGNNDHRSPRKISDELILLLKPK
jgi:adenine-specific DNA-methyltransferase